MVFFPHQISDPQSNIDIHNTYSAIAQSFNSVLALPKENILSSMERFFVNRSSLIDSFRLQINLIETALEKKAANGIKISSIPAERSYIFSKVVTKMLRLRFPPELEAKFAHQKAIELYFSTDEESIDKVYQRFIWLSE